MTLDHVLGPERRRRIEALFSGPNTLPRAIGYVSEVLLGRNAYVEYCRYRADGDVIPWTDGEIELLLDANDRGLAAELLTFGYHEYESSKAYRRELRRLRATVDEVLVLDVGANVGYFVSVAASALARNYRIHAIEPEPRNAELLELNARRIDPERITVEQFAVGATNERVPLYVSTHSNWHQIEPARNQTNEIRDVTRVQMRTLDDYLRSEGISPASVNAVRFDVEGHEKEVLDGMQSLLGANGPLVLFAELHRDQLTADEYEATISTLEDAGFELVSAVSQERVHPVDDIADLYALDVEWDVEVVLRRGY